MGGVVIEARAHAAAEEIEREGGKPTAVTVRARVGVNNGDATRFLRSWREGRLATGVSIASLPPSLFEQTHRMGERAVVLRSAGSSARGRQTCGADIARKHGIKAPTLCVACGRTAADQL